MLLFSFGCCVALLSGVTFLFLGLHFILQYLEEIKRIPSRTPDAVSIKPIIVEFVNPSITAKSTPTNTSSTQNIPHDS